MMEKRREGRNSSLSATMGQQLTLPQLTPVATTELGSKQSRHLIVSIHRDWATSLIGWAYPAGTGGLDPVFLGTSFWRAGFGSLLASSLRAIFHRWLASSSVGRCSSRCLTRTIQSIGQEHRPSAANIALSSPIEAPILARGGRLLTLHGNKEHKYFNLGFDYVVISYGGR